MISDQEPNAVDCDPAPTQSADVRQRATHVRQRRDHHRWMLGVSVCVIFASLLLRIRDSDSVRVAGLDVALPPLCGSRALFNIECPGCGLTRSFVALAAGDVQQSLRYHRLGWLLALAVVAQIPYRTFALWELNANRLSERAWPKWFGNLLIALLVANWLAQIVARL
jgi:hypothetical protein